MAKQTTVITVGYCAQNFIFQGDERTRAFIEIPLMNDRGQPQYNAGLLQSLLSEGWKILSTSTSSGALETGMYTLSHYVVESPEGWTPRR